MHGTQHTVPGPTPAITATAFAAIIFVIGSLTRIFDDDHLPGVVMAS